MRRDEMGDVFKQQYKRSSGKGGELRRYYGNLVDEHGKRKRVALSTDKQAARSMLRDLEREAERRKAGLIDVFAESRKTPSRELKGHAPIRRTIGRMRSR
jgi:hypothetical protein